MMNSETLYWIAFNKIRVFNAKILLYLQKKMNSLKSLWNYEREELNEIIGIEGIKNSSWNKFFNKRKNLNITDCSSEITLATHNEIKILTPDMPEYPNWFVECMENAPITLYIRGNFLIEQNKAISIVGTRNPSYYGRKKAREISQDLAEEGFTIISGLARGIDSIAHVGALDVGGHTIAVLANGLLKHPNETKSFKSPLQVYPSEHTELAEDIIINGGAIISESSFGSRATRYRLLERNRIVAGLSIASVAIEGGERTGTASEINYAHNMNRRIYALKPVDNSRHSAEFPKSLIREGKGIPIKSATDIVSELRKKENKRKKTKKGIEQYIPLSSKQNE